MDKLFPKIDIDPELKLPTGFRSIDELLQGGFKRGELFAFGSFTTPHPPMPEGIRKLLAGEDGVVIGPAESYYLFGGKSLFTWSMILKNPVLLERFKKAAFITLDLEASDGFEKAMEQILGTLVEKEPNPKTT